MQPHLDPTKNTASKNEENLKIKPQQRIRNEDDINKIKKIKTTSKKNEEKKWRRPQKIKSTLIGCDIIEN